ncbi:uncharacterized protein LOC100698102 isoform X1 [Oreochromis niloticus]|uniref:uncharacterized protein LOC100698102 isoform X1 n=1 Tax=Oreochromis niloticus TaxID=8128 RepID=UPI00090476E6|nr:uncharacterized protein LOC100698102 isoform X1 [Oreochromis niloticus]
MEVARCSFSSKDYVSRCCFQQSGINNTGILPKISREVWFSSQGSWRPRRGKCGGCTADIYCSWHRKRQFHFRKECAQRIERLWRDLWVAVTCIYYDVLHNLEEEGLLDISNAAHLFCCHYVFLPQLEDDFNTFCSGWDNHPLRTENNMSPNQLWELGHRYHPVPVPENTQGFQIPDIDWEDSGLSCHNHSSIVVPNTDCPLTEEQMTTFQGVVNPRAASQSFGADVYIMAVQFCQQFIYNRKATYSCRKKFVNLVEFHGFLHNLVMKCNLIFITDIWTITVCCRLVY